MSKIKVHGRACQHCDWARQFIKSNTDMSDFSFSSADAKAILKNHILLSQKMGN